MVRGRKRGGFRQRGGGRVRVEGKPFKRGRGRGGFRGKDRRKQPSAEDLDRDIEQYWGEKVVAEHLDKDMDDYWAKAKDQPKPS